MSDPGNINNTQSDLDRASSMSSKQNDNSQAAAQPPDQSSSTQEASHAPPQPQQVPKSGDDEELSESPGDASMQDSVHSCSQFVPFFQIKKLLTSWISQGDKPKTERQLRLDNEKAERAIAPKAKKKKKKKKKKRNHANCW
ncbi:adenosinetriphosphatase [Puccinia sorghi]|uniref:Adenosinetriphosphatase n=1 Tax=Puccinia sorghi TaxID=27349 RepID=A0A0L6VFZ4_9BASI|nr:adenosinetriphosphatase [Puccinia sorghi]